MLCELHKVSQARQFEGPLCIPQSFCGRWESWGRGDEAETIAASWSDHYLHGCLTQANYGCDMPMWGADRP